MCLGLAWPFVSSPFNWCHAMSHSTLKALSKKRRRSNDAAAGVGAVVECSDKACRATFSQVLDDDGHGPRTCERCREIKRVKKHCEAKQKKVDALGKRASKEKTQLNTALEKQKKTLEALRKTRSENNKVLKKLQVRVPSAVPSRTRSSSSSSSSSASQPQGSFRRPHSLMLNFDALTISMFCVFCVFSGHDLGCCAMVGRRNASRRDQLDANPGQRKRSPCFRTELDISINPDQRQATVREPVPFGCSFCPVSPRGWGPLEHAGLGEPPPRPVPPPDPRPRCSRARSCMIYPAGGSTRAC